MYPPRTHARTPIDRHINLKCTHHSLSHGLKWHGICRFLSIHLTHTCLGALCEFVVNSVIVIEHVLMIRHSRWNILRIIQRKY